MPDAECVTGLDHAYDVVRFLKSVQGQASFSPAEERAKLFRDLRHQSDVCRLLALNITGTVLCVPYGRTEPNGEGMEAFDWFPPETWCSDVDHVIVYIHGGFWKAMDLPESSHWATPVTQAGAIFVALSYRLAPWQSHHAMPGSICKALAQIYERSCKHVQKLTNRSPNIRLHLFGHSAGAQLVLESVMLVISESSKKEAQWLTTLTSLILVSGLYDLRPLVHTSFNTVLNLRSESDAWCCSPLRYFTSIDAKVTCILRSIRVLIAWAEFNPPALIEQSGRLASSWNSALASGSPGVCGIETFCAENEDHFTAIHTLHCGVKTSALLKRVFGFIGLSCK
ncbi:unnamed protein product [Dicrocoelium dendriticum]|nr:unnamed protein product [Dicrocoelium dendriticum]